MFRLSILDAHLLHGLKIKLHFEISSFDMQYDIKERQNHNKHTCEMGLRLGFKRTASTLPTLVSSTVHNGLEHTENYITHAYVYLSNAILNKIQLQNNNNKTRKSQETCIPGWFVK